MPLRNFWSVFWLLLTSFALFPNLNPYSWILPQLHQVNRVLVTTSEIFHWTKIKKTCRGRRAQNQLLVECIRGQKIDQSPCRFFSPKAWPCEILRDNAESLNLAQHPVKLCRLSKMVQEWIWNKLTGMFRGTNSEQVSIISIERCFG